ncbi:hypothetical protein BA768_03835 [Chryseobacterium sp. CBo1]|uniref:DUF4365 domain-containing protein n=1 Tax=Chryseobacterium sp. CBo1 TaxID=1869230 RepID=UPI000810E0DF|nr:DUF4365 domain-containing protein [Chryseobacterium sp. CBo1]OCK50926.1 hypothetical protein BA768_03835 [Chryseobacterium sp. CBo1]
MNRYNSTERLGVNETEKIVIKNLGWIFREQPIVDVGLDAIIEQVENGEPTGKFIAVQIKSGSGNFYRTEKGLSHYVTNIHYNYWLDLCIPIILIAHIPEEGKTYWQEITESNLKKNKKRWKIEIPFKQEFNEKSINKLIKIVSDKNDQKFDIYRGRVDSGEFEDIIEDLATINDATVCINNITALMNQQTEDTNNKTKRFQLLNEDKPLNYMNEVSKIYKALSKDMNLTAKRTETEVELFSQLYSIGFSAFEKLLINLSIFNLKLKDIAGGDINAIKNVPNQIDYALTQFIYLRETVKEVPANNQVAFKEAKKQYIEVLDLLIFEMEGASEMTKRIFEKL